MKPQLCTLTLSPCFCPSHPVYNDHIHILLTFYSFSRLISSFIHLSLSLSLSHMWYAVLCINDMCEIMFICVSSDTCVPWCKHGDGDQCHMLALAFYFFFFFDMGSLHCFSHCVLQVSWPGVPRESSVSFPHLSSGTQGSQMCVNPAFLRLLGIQTHQAFVVSTGPFPTAPLWPFR